MPTPINLTPCLSGYQTTGTKIKIRINGVDYPYWASWNGSIWTPSFVGLKGAVIVDIGACMPPLPIANNTEVIINGDIYHYETADSKYHCGAA